MDIDTERRMVAQQMDLIMTMVPARPWWKFWADDPHVEYEKWKAQTPKPRI